MIHEQIRIDLCDFFAAVSDLLWMQPWSEGAGCTLLSVTQDTNQLLNQQCLCVYVCGIPAHALRRGDQITLNDYWCPGSEGQQEEDRMERGRRTEHKWGVVDERELERGPLLPTVNNTGRHFNYQQPAQINFYCPLDKDRASFALVTI